MQYAFPAQNTLRMLCLSPAIPLRLYSLAYWCKPTIFNFRHSGTLALSPECQSARMSKVKYGGLD